MTFKQLDDADHLYEHIELCASQSRLFYARGVERQMDLCQIHRLDLWYALRHPARRIQRAGQVVTVQGHTLDEDLIYIKVCVGSDMVSIVEIGPVL